MLSAGLLGASLNIPTFGWISNDPSVGDKTEYNTLVRLLYPVASLGKSNEINLICCRTEHMYSMC